MNKIQTDKAPAAIGPYSQAIVINGLVYTSGQIPLCPQTGVIVGETVEEQCRQVIKNLSAVLEAAGSSLSNVVKTTCFITDMAHFEAFNKVYSEYFSEKPARSCVAVKELPKSALVEVEAIAMLP